MALTLLDKLFFVIGVFVLVLGLWKNHAKNVAKSKGYPFPPGPQPKFIVGSSLDIPRERAWYEFLDWKRKYGDIVYAKLFGSGILLLNTMEAINDLLDRRPNNYSDRPALVMVGELMGVNKALAMLNHGPIWKYQRKLIQSPLGPEAVKKYYTSQEDIIAIFLNTLLENPKNFEPQLRLTASRIIMSVTYGLPVQTSDDSDPYIAEAEETMKVIGKASVPGAFLVDLIPLLKYLPSWVPFNTIHRTAEVGRSLHENMITRPFEHVKREVASGTARQSFTLDFLEAEGHKNDPMLKENSEDTIRWVAGSMYAAGVETTHATILSFILAMANYPEAQNKIKQEIDHVIGGGRLPSIHDRKDLPYVNATIKEALRWKVAIPLGVPRRAREADIYQDYYIPAGTTVLPNVWAIAQDERSGIPPEEFAPERFLETCVKATAIDPYSYAFGFGRRVCPGKYLGDNNLFLLITGLMATMNIMKQTDADGNPVDLNPRYTSGLVSHPEPFEVVILPRSSEAVSLVKERLSRVE